MTELLEQIKNDVAMSLGHKSWSNMLHGYGSCQASVVELVATRYATEVAKRSLEKAAEMAKVINWWDSENGIREYMSKVSKQSITDESNILL